MISYLLSNVDWEKGYNSTLSRHLLNDIKNNNKIVFIPTSFNDQEKTNKYLKRNLNAFEMMGLDFKDVVLLSYEMSTTKLVEEIKSADVVFLMGGDTLSQFDFIKEKELITPLRNLNGVMIGVSAGAINMCSHSILTFEHPNKNLHIYKGVGVVDLSVEVHFDVESKKQLDIIKEASKYIDEIYCITDYSSIRVSNEVVNIIGNEIYVYKNNLIKLL